MASIKKVTFLQVRMEPEKIIFKRAFKKKINFSSEIKIKTL